MIATGSALTTGGIATKACGENKAIGWAGKSITAQQQAAANKQLAAAKREAANIARHMRKVELLERELVKELDGFRARNMTVEA